MHIEQKVWEQEVIIGVRKNSLQTWHLSADSTADNFGSGVESQSVESAISSSFVVFVGIVKS